MNENKNNMDIIDEKGNDINNENKIEEEDDDDEMTSEEKKMNQMKEK